MIEYPRTITAHMVNTKKANSYVYFRFTWPLKGRMNDIKFTNIEVKLKIKRRKF